MSCNPNNSRIKLTDLIQKLICRRCLKSEQLNQWQPLITAQFLSDHQTTQEANHCERLPLHNKLLYTQ